MRIGLGGLRLFDSAVVRAAVDEGVRWFDTAAAYVGPDGKPGERFLARALREAGARDARIVTKCGMRRPDGAWVPDGRASSIAEDVARSLDALEGLPIDLLLLHAPDPTTPFSTSLRALFKARDRVRAVGLSNVNRAQLDEALAMGEIGGVQIALGAFDDHAARGGVVQRCAELGIPVFAHSPLGGPKRVSRLARDHELGKIARALDATPAQVVLAYLLALHPSVVPLVGAGRPESIRDAARAARLSLDEETLARLDVRFPGLSSVRVPPRAPVAPRAEVTMVMGIVGAGKSTHARALEGHVRLNRDALGGSLRGIRSRLEDRLVAGDTRLVLDNTYLSRASRADVIHTAHRNQAAVRCVFVDTTIEDAQINIVERMLERHGRLLEPDELDAAAKRDPGMVRPGVAFRMRRELERPHLDEGFASLDVVPFARAPETRTRAGLVVGLDALLGEGRSLDLGSGPVLALGFRPETERARLRAAIDAIDPRIELGLCGHDAGPPRCWCRPPLPGLVLAFARTHELSLSRTPFIGGGPSGATMARVLGMPHRA